MRFLTLLILLSCPPCLAQCVSDSCSNDPLGILGDERLCWDASEGATYYTLAVVASPNPIPCASTNATCKNLAETACYGDQIVVKGCKPNPPGSDLCGPYCLTIPVEILPYSCIRHPIPCAYSDDGDARNDRCEACEYPCYPGAPLRLMNIVPACL